MPSIVKLNLLLKLINEKEQIMLFMIQSSHDYSTCQTHDPEKGPLFKETLANLGNHGVKVHAQYSNRLEHTLFIVCEADTFEALDAAFDPILEMGHLEVTPVMKRE
jgi:hypothetical protein|tara:strand:+ start:1133 stop:1450 length:318 start_codon:yes stop_codon:yes gene_type:complete